MVLKSGCKMFAVVTVSALNSSALRRSLPGALWYLRELMAAMVSPFFGGPVSRRNPWKKVFSKPFRITDTQNCSRRGDWCRFHKNVSIVLLARCYSERWNARWNTKNTLTESVRSFILTLSYSKPMIISPVSFMVCKAKFLFFEHFQSAISTVYFFLFSVSL